MTTNRPQAKSTTQIENDRIIVTEWRFPSGGETGWHRHNFDYVVVPQTNGYLLLETKEGSKLAELRSGVSYFRNAGVEHNVINNNKYEFVFIEIEVKCI